MANYNLFGYCPICMDDFETIEVKQGDFLKVAQDVVKFAALFESKKVYHRIDNEAMTGTT